MGGFDAKLAPSFLAGAAAGFARSALSPQGLASSGDASSYTAALYAAFARDAFYANGALGYIGDEERLSRGIAIAGLARGAAARPHADQIYGAFEFGYNWPAVPRSLVTPFLRVDANTFRQAGFTETGAGGFGLDVADLNSDSVWSTLGVKLSHEFDFGLSSPLSASLKAGWGHEFADSAGGLTAAFEGAPQAPFTVQTARLDRDAAVVGASLSMTDRNNVTLFAKFEGQYGRLSQVSAGTAGLSIAW